MNINFGANLPITAAPTNGVNEVQRITITGTPTGGSFTVTYSAQTTAAIAYNATAAAVQAALEALSNIDVGDISCAGGPLPGSVVNVTFIDKKGGLDQTVMTTTDSLTGGTTPASAITTPTAGVRGTYRGADNGSFCIDTSGKLIYQNTGNKYTPIWVDFSTL